MIKCPNGHENMDEANFCMICQAPLKEKPSPKQEVDLVFCFDTTASMFDEIDDLKKNAADFLEALNEKGVKYKVGLIDFRDTKYPPSDRDAIVVTCPLTEKGVDFHNAVQGLTHAGGEDPEESAFEALVKATELEGFRGGTVRKYIVLVTDAAPRVPDDTGRDAKAITEILLQKDFRLMMVVPRYDAEKKEPVGCDVYEQIKKWMGLKAEIIPLVVDGKRADFGIIRDRIVIGTLVK
jgi:Mg-chelatase subunit ChlD